MLQLYPPHRGVLNGGKSLKDYSGRHFQTAVDSDIVRQFVFGRSTRLEIGLHRDNRERTAWNDGRLPIPKKKR